MTNSSINNKNITGIISNMKWINKSVNYIIISF